MVKFRICARMENQNNIIIGARYEWDIPKSTVAIVDANEAGNITVLPKL